MEFPTTDHSLIDKLRGQGDAASWIAFVAIYQPAVFRMARRRGLQDADAQDVIQQVFWSIARAIESWERSENEPPFRAWLTTIARNAITKALVRRPKDRAAGSSSVAEALREYPGRDATASELIVETRNEMVRWACERIRSEFSEATWLAFHRTAIECVPVAEVARMMGRSVGSIYVARYRVITRLKEKTQELSLHWDIERNSNAS